MTTIGATQGALNAGHDMQSERRPGRSIGAVLAGLFAIFLVTTLTDVVLHLTGVFPRMDAPPMSDPLFLLATAYRIVYGIGGSWVTARLAPARPMKHALVLGGIGFVLSTIGGIVMCDAGPLWYSVAIVAIAMPCAWLGGRLAGAR